MLTKTTKAVTGSSYLLKQTVQIQAVHVQAYRKKYILYTFAKRINKSRSSKYRVIRCFMQEEGAFWNKSSGVIQAH